MPDYRIYMIKNGHIAAGYDFNCETDEQARAEARSMLRTYKTAEVWAGTRRVSVEVLDTPWAKPAAAVEFIGEDDGAPGRDGVLGI
jgi:hypothetical protein